MDQGARLMGFRHDDKTRGFDAGKSYPGMIATDGAYVIMANEEGQLHRVALPSVKVDVDVWRKAAGVGGSLASESLSKMAEIVRRLHERIATVKQGVKPTALIETFRADLRAMAELVDPVLAKELWALVDNRQAP